MIKFHVLTFRQCFLYLHTVDGICYTGSYLSCSSPLFGARGSKTAAQIGREREGDRERGRERK